MAADGRLTATSVDPWLSLDGLDRSWRGAFVEITYRASLLDEPARPVFRFRQADGAVIDRIGAAPCAGSGRWIGRVPHKTTSLSISPTNRVGRFDFVIERVRRRSWLALVAGALPRSPHYAWRALALRLIGFEAEADAMLAWAIGSSIPLRHYATWRAERQRVFAAAGIDRCRCDTRRKKIVCVVIPGHHEAGRSRTFASLRSQIFESWSAFEVAEADTRDHVRRPGEPAALFDEAELWPDDALVCVLEAGDVLVEEAFAYASEQAERYPDDQVFYGDYLEDGVDAVRFMPGWSPRLWRESAFVQRPVFVRAGHLRSTPSFGEFLVTGRVSEDLVSCGVRPLRRVLATLAPARRCDRSAATPSAREAARRVSSDATATVIIPTRGDPKRLARLLASMQMRRASVSFDVLIMNNGGSREAIRAVADRAGGTIALDVIDFDRPFNFSAICNLGAAASRADVVVFLNDDMEVLSDDWLARLVDHAMMPKVGAVGAKLTYPRGRLQHIGIVLGWGDCAGHFGAQTGGSDPGWAGRHVFVHEIGAVTGACLAVARLKFHAVGGFDEKAFPIELGDVDLCLKLRARGWTALVDPNVRLMHAESKSRGRATFRRLATYAPERAVFRERWAHVLRDDPYFHPGLSLYSWQAALG